jgi:RNA exonuclease 1
MARKRKRTAQNHSSTDQEDQNFINMGQTLSVLRESPSNPAQSEEGPATEKRAPATGEAGDGDGWQTVESRAAKRQKKLESQESSSYPQLTHAPNARLQTHVKTSDLQNLILYILADGLAPQWISIRHRAMIRKVVVLMVPGLEAGMFDGTVPLDDTQLETSDKSSSPLPESKKEGRQKTSLSPDDYYPVRLDAATMPDPLGPLADIFPHVWPIRALGDSKMNRLHSPLGSILSTPIPKTKAKKQKGPQPAQVSKDWKDEPTPITAYVASLEELRENDYVLHPAAYSTEQDREQGMAMRRIANQTPENGWVDTHVDGMQSLETSQPGHIERDLAAGLEVLCVDCEMCKTGEDTYELTRISIVDWNGSVVMDELVKPSNPITDYLTA